MKLSRRQLLAGAGIAAASSLSGAGTYAALSDREEATASFQAGRVILKVSPETQEFGP
jgi:predicted ribosomally synthesized peptide with SipW-like signal peptide